ncbi:MAG: ATP-binding protein [Actinobacteria bacterium]|nr:ATP-binding protein [Actinomycetota bacterium]
MAKKLGDALREWPMPERQPGGEPSPEDDVCPICRGSGYLRADVPYGHPFFGRLFACECLEAAQWERAFEELQRFSNLGPFKDKTFNNFKTKYIQGVKQAYDEALKYASNPHNRWLVLLGGYGCGKTHLAAAIANEAAQHHLPCLFTVVPDLLDHLRSTFGPTSTIQYDDLFEKVRTTPLLVLDDLGTENATPWAEEKLYQILNYRYNEKLPTVITTNRRLENIDGRIRSRMQDVDLVTLVEIKASDYRLRKGGSRQ